MSSHITLSTPYKIAPKKENFAKQYARLIDTAKAGIKTSAEDLISGDFAGEKHGY